MKRLSESKFVASHRGAPHRDHYIKRHHSRFPDYEKNKEEKKTREAVLAAAGLAALSSKFNHQMLRHLMAAESALKQANSATTTHAKRVAQGNYKAEIAKLKRLLRESYLKSYRFGVASSGLKGKFLRKSFLSPEETRWVDSAVKHENRFLNGLLGDIKSGKSVASLRYRVGLYAKALKAAFTAGQVLATGQDTLIFWRLHPEAQHCQDCLMLAANSPYTKENLPTQPKAGLCQCVFTPASRVETWRGMIPIADVRVNDFVRTHRNQWKRVTATPRSVCAGDRDAVSVTVEGFRRVGFTAEHKIWTSSGWTPIGEVKSRDLSIIDGDSLTENELASPYEDQNGEINYPTVAHSYMYPNDEEGLGLGVTLYDLTVEDDHSFIVEGVVSSNCGSNCRCELEYQKVEPSVAEKVRQGSLDRNYFLRKLKGMRK